MLREQEHPHEGNGAAMITEQEAANLLEIHLPVLETELEYAFTRRVEELYERRERNLIDEEEAQETLQKLEHAFYTLSAMQDSLIGSDPEQPEQPAAPAKITIPKIPIVKYEEVNLEDSEWAFADEIAYGVIDSSPTSSRQTMKLPVIGQYVVANTATNQEDEEANALRLVRMILLETLLARRQQLDLATQHTTADFPPLTPDSVTMPRLVRMSRFLSALLIVIYVPLMIYWSIGLLSPARSVTATIERKFISTGRLSSLYQLPYYVIVAWSERDEDIEIAAVDSNLYNSLHDGQKVQITYDRMNVLVLPIPHTTIQVVQSIDGKSTGEPSQFTQWLALCVPETLLVIVLLVLLNNVASYRTVLAQVRAKLPVQKKGRGKEKVQLVLEWDGPHRALFPVTLNKAESYAIDHPVRVVYHYTWPRGNSKLPVTRIDSIQRIKEKKA